MITIRIRTRDGGNRAVTPQAAVRHLERGERLYITNTQRPSQASVQVFGTEEQESFAVVRYAADDPIPGEPAPQQIASVSWYHDGAARQAVLCAQETVAGPRR